MDKFVEQFNAALKRIEISGERLKLAISSHTEIREVLLGSERLRDWGLDPILIGSYARDTGIYPGKDVDVFGRLYKLNTTIAPRTVYDAFLDVLKKKYRDRAQPQRRSIKVKFTFDDEEFSIDSVPAVRFMRRWAIPSGDQALWERDWESHGWCETDPEKLTQLTQALNACLKIGGCGAYVPTVKLIKQIRNHSLGDSDPGGLFFELMTYWTFKTNPTADNFAEILTYTLRSIANQLARMPAVALIDPVLERPYEPVVSQPDIERAAAKFSDIAARAESALSAETCPAAALWRNIIGKNGRGWCFALPEGCDETGKKITPITSASSRGSRESHGFG
jgi:hypothetical protein